MRIPIISPDNFANKKAHSKYLIDNKSKFIAQKKSMQIVSDAVCFSPSIAKDPEQIKTGEVSPVDFTGLVDVVGNTHNWLDSHLDVLITGSANKTIKENSKNVFHLASHVQDWTGEIGTPQEIAAKPFTYSELGIKGYGDGITEAVWMRSQLDPTLNDYAKILYDRYRRDKVKQHSIGLRYVKIEMAINDEDEEKEFDFWNKYYQVIINKDKADKYGYFWVVSEYKLLEISAVLWGSNEITPTLNNNVKNEPLEDTHEDVEEKTEPLILNTPELSDDFLKFYLKK